MDKDNRNTPSFSSPPTARTDLIYYCDICTQVIPSHRPRVRCLICHEYDSCADCHIMQASSGSHTAEHQCVIYRHGQKHLLRGSTAPLQSQPAPPAPNAYEQQLRDERAEADREAQLLAELERSQDELAASESHLRSTASAIHDIVGGWSVDDYGNRTYDSGSII